MKPHGSLDDWFRVVLIGDKGRTIVRAGPQSRK